MKQLHVMMMVEVVLLLCASLCPAQQAAATNTNVAVPTVVQYGGVLTDVNGKPLTGITGVTFYLYKEQQGGSPLWMETQNVQPDKTGHYSVMLGVTTSTGLPGDLFVQGEARWLGVQPQGQEEQPRVMLLSVPYALKAGDAATVGGLPPSAFLLAAPSNVSSSTVSHTSAKLKSAISPDVSGTGTTDYIPLWTNSTGGLGNSLLYQSGSSIGVGTTTPARKLDVDGDVNATGFALGGNEFAFGSYNNGNAFLGFAGNATMTGAANTATGQGALGDNTTGFANTANGIGALFLNTTGGYNTATGYQALQSNVSGLSNTANGYNALENDRGSNNTALGYTAGQAFGVQYFTGWGNTFIGANSRPSTGTLNNATAIGANAVVTASNALVLGSINGLNGATASTNVGINTTAPIVALDVGGGVIHVGGSTSPTTTAQGAYLGWNALTGGTGETDFINNQGLGTGGFAFMNTPKSGTPRTTLMAIDGNGESGINGNFLVSTFSAPNSSLLSAIGGVNVSSFQTLQLQNLVTPSSSNFIEAQFDASDNATLATDTLGDLYLKGTIGTIAGPVSESGKPVELFSMESPEVWFEDFGSGRLSSGSTIIALDPRFVQTVNLAIGYHVFLTAMGDCKGLFVTGKTNHGFEVHELSGGQSSIEFDYRIVAHRNGHEAERLPTAVMPTMAPTWDAELLLSRPDEAHAQPAQQPTVQSSASR